MRTFVYQPRSGDRVFAQKEASSVTVTLFANGSRVVEGDYVELAYNAAAPGRWWRDTARRVAEQIVQAVGGLAWDNQGSIHLIVPPAAALTAASIMQAAGGEDLQWEDRVRAASGATAQEGRLLQAGILRVATDRDGHLIPAVAPSTPPWKAEAVEAATEEATA